MGFVINPFPILSGIADALQRRSESSEPDRLVSVARDYASKLSSSWKSMVGPMLRRVHTQYVALMIFFTFCPVIGSMCALPDLSVAEEIAWLAEETAGMTCPMDGTIMCPQSATSSPERQVKNGAAIAIDHGQIMFSPAAVLPASSVQTLWSRSSPYSIFPLPIESSSVLRI